MLLAVCLLLSVVSLSGGMESGIVGGKEAKPHSRPYMASLQHKGSHKCGGMLIKDDYVLTSAHCVPRSELSSPEHFKVLLGAHNISKSETSQQRIKVKQFFKHPMSNWNVKKNYSYDIMLLQLETKAKLNKCVKVIALPKIEVTIPADVTCTIAGWGYKEPQNYPSSVLREVSLKLESNSKCKRQWQHYFSPERMICTVSDGKKGFCQGDSGGPLICENKPHAIAAFTYPDDCTNAEYPQIYIKISAFHHWIQQVIHHPY